MYHTIALIFSVILSVTICFHFLAPLLSQYLIALYIQLNSTSFLQYFVISNSGTMNKMQDQLVEEQDQHLEQINEIAIRLKAQGKNMNRQIDEQGNIINELNTEIDNTTKKLNFVQKKLGKLLKTNDMGQICTILILFVILIIMIFLVIYT